jgi:NTP pyrophosphatase (non-canonical NTP hydrolase)
MTTLDQPAVLADMQARVHYVNTANGWNQGERNPLEDCMLLVTEVAEMAEAYRDDMMNTTIREDGKPEGFGSECADVLIRLLDTCQRYNVNLHAEFERKLAHNATRGHRHGGKVA